ncbi:MAG: hypothetical protein WA902_23750 [Thermosynechococcaceae cyanobacterium]
MNGFLLAAAVVSLVTFLVHLFAGGREVVNPLLNASDLLEVSKLTTYYCWHIVTFVLLTMACAYGYAAFVQLDSALVVVMTGIAAACTILSVGLIVARNLNPLEYPQWMLLGPIAILGTLGLTLA